MDNKIEEYLLQNKILTIATCLNNSPYCAICYYAFDPSLNCFYFISHDETRHIEEGKVNNHVAGTVTSISESIATNKGIQFTGRLHKAEKEELVIAKKNYFKTFPLARLSKASIWKISLTYVKMTDNTLGFGKKRIWKKEIIEERSNQGLP